MLFEKEINDVFVECVPHEDALDALVTRMSEDLNDNGFKVQIDFLRSQGISADRICRVLRESALETPIVTKL